MPSPLEQLCHEVQLYLQGMQELNTVDDAVAEVFVSHEDDPEAVQLAGALQNVLAEWSRGDRSQSELRQGLEATMRASTQLV